MQQKVGMVYEYVDSYPDGGRRRLVDLRFIIWDSLITNSFKDHNFMKYYLKQPLAETD
jgi:hypothetical protein